MEQNVTQEVEETEQEGFLSRVKRLTSSRYAGLVGALVLGVILAIPISIVFVGAAQSDREARLNVDPRVGTVYVKDSNGRETGVRKVCNGTTLVYLGGMFTANDVIPDSPECR